MADFAVFIPHHPPPTTTLANQLHIDVCRVYVWELLIPPNDPIIQERMIFGIQLPNVPCLVCAQLGMVVMRDQNLIVFQLVTDYPGAPPLIAVARNLCTAHPYGLTQLSPAVYADMNLTYIPLMG